MLKSVKKLPIFGNSFLYLQCTNGTKLVLSFIKICVMKTNVKNSTQVVENQLVNNVNKSKSVENQQVSKLTKLEQIEKSIKRGLNSENRYYKLLAISANAKKESFSLSKIHSTFIEYSIIQGENMLTDKQKSLLTFTKIKNIVKNTEKYKNKVLFSFHDITLRCNGILKAEDKSIKIAQKVAKQGGKITTKK